MTNIGSRHYDEIFADMQEELEKFAGFPKYRFGNKQEFVDYIAGLSCDQIKQYQAVRVRAGFSDIDPEAVFNTHHNVRKCRGMAANDEAVVAFAINYITKIADELDKNGFIEAANILDETLQKFAALHDCEDCE